MPSLPGRYGDRRHFYYNENWQCVEERIEAESAIAPNPTKQYVWHPHYIDALAVSYDGSSTKHYYMHDANFNVTAAADDTGAVVERYAYTPYGEATILNGTSDSDGSEWSEDTNGSDIGNEFLFTGRRLDPETGLQQSRYRYYHAQMGRWINRDPIGYRGGLNLYGYVGGRPTYYVDPSGLVIETIWDIGNTIYDGGVIAVNGAEEVWNMGGDADTSLDWKRGGTSLLLQRMG